MTKPSSFWTTEIIETAVKLWASGCSATEIAPVIGTTRNSVLGFIHRNKNHFPNRQDKPILHIDKIAELYDQGVSVALIGDALGYTKGQISGLIKRNSDRFPTKKSGRKRADDKKSVSVDRIQARKSPRNDKVNRLSKFNPNAGSKASWYVDPPLDEYETSRLPGVSFMDNDGCMYPLTPSSPHMFCGCRRELGKRYCEYHVEKTNGYKGIDISYRNVYDKNVIRVEVI